VVAEGVREMKVALYARCSTNETRQDVEVQFSELRRYCAAYGWEATEFFEYDSGYKGEQKVLRELLDRIRKKEFSVLMVHSLDRFSRQPPTKTEVWLAFIVAEKCRFISLQEHLDSENEMMWFAMKGLWSYFAHLFSRKLSEKIRSTVRRNGVTKSYRGKKWGRPAVEIDRDLVLRLHESGRSIRAIAAEMNLSRSLVHSVLKSARGIIKEKGVDNGVSTKEVIM
jgi:DNA invertase Pin-like site-specific DNA recombinase